MTEDYFGRLCLKYRDRGALLDSNLLLLYFVGLYRPQLIGSYKRLRAYSKLDFETVNGAFRFFRKIVVTPNVLTEVSNLSFHLELHHRVPYFDAFRRAVATLTEEFIPSIAACEDVDLGRLGLTDTGVLRLSASGLLVLSDDLSLCSALTSRGIDSINLNHLRMARWRWI
ncbi:MAG: hypothetical protein AB1752_02340 [Candidatus Zixiibacteriota bacterium]